MKKVNWGILSTAKIGLERVIPAMQNSQYCSIKAIASRNLIKAKQAADKLNIPKAYGSYEEILDDPDVEALYISLPNHLHVPWSIKTLQAGKHVLCEKPIGLNASEVKKLLKETEKYPNLKIMESFMYRYHPQWQYVKNLIKEWNIGNLKTIRSFFSFYNRDPNNIRNKAEIGGGALMDIGCYCVSLSRFIFDDEPHRVCSIMEYDPEFKIDRLTSGLLEFNQGTSIFTCSTQLSRYQRVEIFGSKGYIIIERPFTPATNEKCEVRYSNGNDEEKIVFDICNQYTIQVDLFSQSILENKAVPTPLSDALYNMYIIDNLFESNNRKRWVVID